MANQTKNRVAEINYKGFIIEQCSAGATITTYGDRHGGDVMWREYQTVEECKAQIDAYFMGREERGVWVWTIKPTETAYEYRPEMTLVRATQIGTLDNVFDSRLAAENAAKAASHKTGW